MKRGRPSGASLAITSTEPVETIDRQRPPHDLTDEEVEVWAVVVSTEPADWFSPSTVPLLAQYCRHVVQARRIGELIERATGDPNLEIGDYDRLLKMQQRESCSVAMLSTKMRISQHSQTNHRGNKKPIQSRKLWEG